MRERAFRKCTFLSGRFILIMMMAFTITGCIPEKPWHVKEITGHLPDLKFSLMSDSGQLVTAKTYEGYILLMYFGFTNCDAECPVSMARLAHVAQLLGDSANHMRVLFVTLDPERDTPQVLERYVARFDPLRAIGLTGETDDIESLTKRYRAAYRPRSRTGGTDGIIHGDAIYIFDSQGQARLLATSVDTDESLAEDLLRLLKYPVRGAALAGALPG